MAESETITANLTPLERAVQALEDMLRTRGAPYDEYDPQAMLRAVLIAIREPSEAMKTAGGEQVGDVEYGAGWYESISEGRFGRTKCNEQAQKAWSAMIDAMLAEEG